jgi:cysteine synthase A
LISQCEFVAKVTERDDTGGFLKTRLERVRHLLASKANSYWTNQYENPDAMAAHYHLTGAEIARVPVDYVFLGVSTAGTLAGVSQRVKKTNPSVRIVAVDVEGSVAFGHPPGKRLLSGLGSSIVPPLLALARTDDVVMVAETEAVAGCHELLERHGLFVGASTGAVYAAIRKYFAAGIGMSRPRVMFLCCDRGTAYLHNVFDRSWAAVRRASLERAEGKVLQASEQARAGRRHQRIQFQRRYRRDSLANPQREYRGVHRGGAGGLSGPRGWRQRQSAQRILAVQRQAHGADHRLAGASG